MVGPAESPQRVGLCMCSPPVWAAPGVPSLEEAGAEPPLPSPSFPVLGEEVASILPAVLVVDAPAAALSEATSRRLLVM